MKKIKNFVANKKGVSSVFISIYVLLLIIVLISTLFSVTAFYQSSLDSSLKSEQKRLQEEVLVTGPGGLKMSETNPNIVEFLNVTNIGAITIQVKALYIDDKFVYDPSVYQNSYIQPSGYIWLDLKNSPQPITEADLSKTWAIVTERGTKVSETGLNIRDGDPGGNSMKDNYQFGPIVLRFYEFKWSNDGRNTWNNGWTIPQTSNGGSTVWRVEIANIDDRPIVLNSGTCFTLVQNSQQQNKVAIWYLDTANSPLVIFPRHYYFLYFSVYNGPSLSSLYNPNPICSNFLTIVGDFRETSGSLTPMGQTIPFEAVLLTP